MIFYWLNELTTCEIILGKFPLGEVPLGKYLTYFSMVYLEHQRTAVTLTIPGMLAGKSASQQLMISLPNWLVDQSSSMKMLLFSPFLMFIWVS